MIKLRLLAAIVALGAGCAAVGGVIATYFLVEIEPLRAYGLQNRGLYGDEAVYDVEREIEAAVRRVAVVGYTLGLITLTCSATILLCIRHRSK